MYVSAMLGGISPISKSTRKGLHFHSPGLSESALTEPKEEALGPHSVTQLL